HQHGKKAFWNAGSLCHGFGASPIHYFQTSVLGVRPLLPGFKEFSLAPEPHDLEFAEGRIPTPSGVIIIEWRKDGKEIIIDVDIPHGCTAVTAAGKLSSGHHRFNI
ncbi:MAG: alpha-L-rhamnosidase C-terminal domain-containing protein, partial [Phycisphaerae bacterium]